MAWFTPTLEILDRNGQLVMEEGDAVTGACVAGPAEDPDSLLLIDGMLVLRGSV